MNFMISIPGVRVATAGFYPELFDWFKALRQLDMRLSMSGTNDPLRHAHIETREVWLELGKVCGFDVLSRSFQDFECMYPRCPDPQMGGAYLCDEGNVSEMYYCCVRCQQA